MKRKSQTDRRKEVEAGIRNDLARIRTQLQDANDSQLVTWPIPGVLACAQQPLRDHPEFGGYNPLPPHAKRLVEEWVARVKEAGIRSIICLLEPRQLDRYYVRGGLALHPEGLLGYYRACGLQVEYFPLTDYQRPPESEMEKILRAFTVLPKPVLVHCSAGIDRTTPVAAYIVLHLKQETGPTT